MIPSVDEDEGVEGKEEMPEESIDAYVASDGFRLQARRFHEQLLWSNPSGVRISSAPMKIMNHPFEGTTLEIWAQCAGAPQVYRGGDGSHSCQNKPQSKIGYTLDGTPLPSRWAATRSVLGKPMARQVSPCLVPTMTRGAAVACGLRAERQGHRSSTVKEKVTGPRLRSIIGPAARLSG